MKVVIGGSAMPQGLCKMALERGIDVFTGYGISETGPLQTINHLSSSEMQKNLDDQAKLRVRTGKSVLLCDVRVVDADMKSQPRDGKSQGEVVFRSPWLTQGYLKYPEKSETLWQGGYLHSGDIGTIAPDGCLQIRDRVKDVIKTGGEWISSLTLEDLISQYPGVDEVAVISVPDAKWGERPLALVVPAADAKLDTEDIRRHLGASADKGVISKYGVPDKVLLVEALAKTSVGKLDKKTLRKTYGDTT